MRIVWEEQHNRFLAELTAGESFRDDLDSVKLAGFKTDGAPLWHWFTTKSSTLDKLRKTPPKSGLVITQLALEKYQFLSKQESQKQQTKKEFLKRKKQAEELKDTWPEYVDPETGIICKQIAPLETKFVMSYTRPPAPETHCFVCGSPTYFYEEPDLCIWCAK